eukprot:MONOS_16282.1-p1 / transcript=MONOS_16282.1 / gene=MONOS_16282 / organism=Monocercomonoides_exilis_PA203 / gene_product=unspecified product / transcript_product=unspecified product / location=Mono_scaffold01612:4538-5904(+) / protein_length=298 / sequence_SO=supercontig / SO=protein_coding / is_pseudo=false
MDPLPSLAASVGTKSWSKLFFSSADANAFQSIYDLTEEGAEKEIEAAMLWMEDVVLPPAAIALAVLEEREEAEEGERGCKEGEEKGKEKGEEDGGRDGGDGNEEKGGYPTAHREHVERIEEIQVMLEEAMTPMVVDVLGLSGLRFVKAETEVGADKQHSVEPEECSFFPSDGIQQENRRAVEEAADGSLGITSDGRGGNEQTLDVLGELNIPLHRSCAKMQHATKSEAGMKHAIVEDLAVMFFVLVEWFEHKAEENEFVCGIIISQDELIRLANAHTLMKQRLLCCGVTASLGIAHG